MSSLALFVDRFELIKIIGIKKHGLTVLLTEATYAVVKFAFN